MASDPPAASAIAAAPDADAPTAARRRFGPERLVLFHSPDPAELGIRLEHGADGRVRIASVPSDEDDDGGGNGGGNGGKGGGHVRKPSLMGPDSGVVEGRINAGDVICECAGVNLRRPVSGHMWNLTKNLMGVAPRPIEVVVAEEVQVGGSEDSAESAEEAARTGTADGSYYQLEVASPRSPGWGDAADYGGPVDAHDVRLDARRVVRPLPGLGSPRTPDSPDPAPVTPVTATAVRDPFQDPDRFGPERRIMFHTESLGIKLHRSPAEGIVHVLHVAPFRPFVLGGTNADYHPHPRTGPDGGRLDPGDAIFEVGGVDLRGKVIGVAEWADMVHFVKHVGRPLEMVVSKDRLFTRERAGLGREDERANEERRRMLLREEEEGAREAAAGGGEDDDEEEEEEEEEEGGTDGKRDGEEGGGARDEEARAPGAPEEGREEPVEAHADPFDGPSLGGAGEGTEDDEDEEVEIVKMENLCYSIAMDDVCGLPCQPAVAKEAEGATVLELEAPASPGGTDAVPARDEAATSPEGKDASPAIASPVRRKPTSPERNAAISPERNDGTPAWKKPTSPRGRASFPWKRSTPPKRNDAASHVGAKPAPPTTNDAPTAWKRPTSPARKDASPLKRLTSPKRNDDSWIRAAAPPSTKGNDRSWIREAPAEEDGGAAPPSAKKDRPWIKNSLLDDVADAPSSQIELSPVEDAPLLSPAADAGIDVPREDDSAAADGTHVAPPAELVPPEEARVPQSAPPTVSPSKDNASDSNLAVDALVDLGRNEGAAAQLRDKFSPLKPPAPFLHSTSTANDSFIHAKESWHTAQARDSFQTALSSSPVVSIEERPEDSGISASPIWKMPETPSSIREEGAKEEAAAPAPLKSLFSPIVAQPPTPESPVIAAPRPAAGWPSPPLTTDTLGNWNASSPVSDASAASAHSASVASSITAPLGRANDADDKAEEAPAITGSPPKKRQEMAQAILGEKREVEDDQPATPLPAVDAGMDLPKPDPSPGIKTPKLEPTPYGKQPSHNESVYHTAREEDQNPATPVQNPNLESASYGKQQLFNEMNTTIESHDVFLQNLRKEFDSPDSTLQPTKESRDDITSDKHHRRADEDSTPMANNKSTSIGNKHANAKIATKPDKNDHVLAGQMSQKRQQPAQSPTGSTVSVEDKKKASWPPPSVERKSVPFSERPFSVDSPADSPFVGDVRFATPAQRVPASALFSQAFVVQPTQEAAGSEGAKSVLWAPTDSPLLTAKKKVDDSGGAEDGKGEDKSSAAKMLSYLQLRSPMMQPREMPDPESAKAFDMSVVEVDDTVNASFELNDTIVYADDMEGTLENCCGHITDSLCGANSMFEGLISSCGGGSDLEKPPQRQAKEKAKRNLSPRRKSLLGRLRGRAKSKKASKPDRKLESYGNLDDETEAREESSSMKGVRKAQVQLVYQNIRGQTVASANQFALLLDDEICV